MEKEELIRRINKLLNAEINLSRLPKSELEKLYNAIKSLVKEEEEKAEIMETPIRKILEKPFFGGKKIGDMSIAEIIETIKQKGLFGLGVIPYLWKTFTSTLETVKEGIEHGGTEEKPGKS